MFFVFYFLNLDYLFTLPIVAVMYPSIYVLTFLSKCDKRKEPWHQANDSSDRENKRLKPFYSPMKKEIYILEENLVVFILVLLRSMQDLVVIFCTTVSFFLFGILLKYYCSRLG